MMKMNKIKHSYIIFISKNITIIFLLLIATISNAQFSYQKLVDKGRTKQAFTKAQKKLRADLNNVSALYDVSILYILLNNDTTKKLSYNKHKYNADKAYYYTQKAITNFSKINNKEKQKLNKKLITQKVLNELNNEVCDAVVNVAEINNNIATYQKLMKKYSDDEIIILKATDLIHEIHYKLVVEQDIKRKYQDFIKKYPKAKQVSLAQKRIKEIETEQQIAKKRTKDYLSKTHDYSHLKAVIVLGRSVNIDYDYINRVKEFFTKKSIKVKIIKPNTIWEDVVKASKGANFFLYQGHGTKINGKIGGLFVNENMITSEIVEKDIKLARNAVILFQGVCFSAGTSASDGDKDIGVNTAKNRITSYSKPYIKNGAGVYYASISAFLSLLDDFFKDKTIETIYREQSQDYYHINRKEVLENYRYNSNYKISFSSEEYSNRKLYVNATVYKPGFSIEELIEK